MPNEDEIPENIKLAEDLRLLANVFEKNPELPLVNYLFVYGHTREQAKAVGASFGSIGVKKVYEHDELRLNVQLQRVRLSFEFPRDKVCTLIHPAIPPVYDCEPLLADEKDDKEAADLG